MDARLKAVAKGADARIGELMQQLAQQAGTVTTLQDRAVLQEARILTAELSLCCAHSMTYIRMTHPRIRILVLERLTCISARLLPSFAYQQAC